MDSGTSPGNPRQQLNEVAGWIDASNVYGSDIEHAEALRTFDGNGYLLVSAGGLLPYNEGGLANAGGVRDQMFLAGDVRANEQVGLTVMHTLFVREHNRLIDQFLFGAPGSGGFDLVSLNIQCGRDHGLPGYNHSREALGLAPAHSFSNITSYEALQRRLASVHDHVDEVDLWVGGLAEDHVDGAMVGELFRAILTHQFTVFRDGDRFWYQNQFNRQQVADLERTTLAAIIRRNTDIGDELPGNVFRYNDPQVHNRGPRRPGMQFQDSGL